MKQTILTGIILCVFGWSMNAWAQTFQVQYKKATRICEDFNGTKFNSAVDGEDTEFEALTFLASGQLIQSLNPDDMSDGITYRLTSYWFSDTRLEFIAVASTPIMPGTSVGVVGVPSSSVIAGRMTWEPGPTGQPLSVKGRTYSVFSSSEGECLLHTRFKTVRRLQ